MHDKSLKPNLHLYFYALKTQCNIDVARLSLRYKLKIYIFKLRIKLIIKFIRKKSRCCRTIVVVLRSILLMMMVSRGGAGRRAGSMKTHVREDHPGFLQEDHHSFVCSVRRPYIGTLLEFQHDKLLLARKGSRSAIPSRFIDRRDPIAFRKT